jgi:hypothetical protein
MSTQTKPLAAGQYNITPHADGARPAYAVKAMTLTGAPVSFLYEGDRQGAAIAAVRAIHGGAAPAPAPAAKPKRVRMNPKNAAKLQAAIAVRNAPARRRKPDAQDALAAIAAAARCEREQTEQSEVIKAAAAAFRRKADEIQAEIDGLQVKAQIDAAFEGTGRKQTSAEARAAMDRAFGIAPAVARHDGNKLVLAKSQQPKEVK